MIKRIHIIFLTILCSSLVQAMVFDNRYLPLIQKPYISTYDAPSHLYLDIFFITGKRAFAYEQLDNDEVGIPEILGAFDEGEMGRSLDAVGLPNPLPFPLQKGTFPWTMNGKIQAEGVTFASQIALTRHMSLGFNWMVMRLNSRINFALNLANDTYTIEPSDVMILDEARRQMFSEIGISCGFASEIGFGDLDAYMRFDWSCDYAYKFRAIDLGLRIGGLFPVGHIRDINNPASIPFGGNGFYGAYLQGEAEFELKEDWKLGGWLRVSKRFSRVSCQRMPVHLEPDMINNKLTVFSGNSQLFGPIVGPVNINPGATVIWLPYFNMEGIRDGFGAGLQYTLIKHFRDTWTDYRADQTVPSNLVQVNNLSRWTAEFVTINLFYDFGKVKQDRGFSPIATLTWDIPVNFIGAEGVSKSHKIALGIQFNF